MSRWRVVGINFDHMHMGDLLRHVHDHPSAQIVGICDQSADKMSQAADFGIPASAVFTDLVTCLKPPGPVGTLTDPWTIQPQPRCGFVVVGRDGSISSYDYDDHVTVQTRANPMPSKVLADELPAGQRNPVEYLLGCVERGEPVTGPLQPALCLTAQRIVDTAALSAQQKRTLELIA